ncbi:MAG: electron transfer flavoprotein beta subunit/FixA family protein [Saprospirales bacterium]|nr:MAG: electron transfer flavoprotein beta subunit/FixA family protein [Saprospirales bacterium]
MKLLVCVSKTPDTTAKVDFTSDSSSYNEDGKQFIMNPYDEWYALVRALELKEANGGEVVIINAGPASNDAILRKGLAIGADKAIRIDCDPQTAFEAAGQVATYAKDEGFDIVFCGKETIDYNGSVFGGMLAEILDVPFISYASKMEFADGKATINRDVEGGVEVVEAKTPFVISAAKGLAEQRIPNMRGIMMAKRKPLDIKTGSEIENKVKVLKFELPPAKGSVKMIDPENMDELVRLLHEESKVI